MHVGAWVRLQNYSILSPTSTAAPEAFGPSRRLKSEASECPHRHVRRLQLRVGRLLLALRSTRVNRRLRGVCAQRLRAVAQRLFVIGVKVVESGKVALPVQPAAAWQVSCARLPHQRRLRDLAASFSDWALTRYKKKFMLIGLLVFGTKIDELIMFVNGE